MCGIVPRPTGFLRVPVLSISQALRFGERLRVIAHGPCMDFQNAEERRPLPELDRKCILNARVPTGTCYVTGNGKSRLLAWKMGAGNRCQFRNRLGTGSGTCGRRSAHRPHCAAAPAAYVTTQE